MSALIDRLRGGLIASCQPVDDGPMDRPEIVAAMAAAAIQGGAAGVRIEGVENVRATRGVVREPIIGIVKTDSPGTPVRITVSVEDVENLIAAGADIVAYDATDRPRKIGRDAVLKAILANGAQAMADCATFEDGRHALLSGASILGTTLSGYTKETAGAGNAPDLELVRRFQDLGAFVMAEGRYDTPELAADAMRAGADAVTVGSSLTRLEIVTGRFAAAIRQASSQDHLSGFAIDLGGTKTAAARVEKGQILEQDQVVTKGTASPQDQIATVQRLLVHLGYQRGDPLGVAVTGRVDRAGNWYAVNRDTLTQIDHFPLRQEMHSAIGPAEVINDAAAATLAEHRLGSGRGHEHFGYITVSTGVGGGLILNGRLHESANGFAGHFGFSSSPTGSLMCGSGRLGTVESVAGGNALAAVARQAGHEGLNARAIFARAAKGDAWAVQLVDKSAAAVSDLAANLVATIGMRRIAIGGSIGLAEGYLERLRKCQATLPELFYAELVKAELEHAAPLLGALLRARERRTF